MEKILLFVYKRKMGEVEADENIADHATKYYKSLFGPSKEPFFTKATSNWEEIEKISNEDNEMLTRSFSMELKMVVVAMEKNTAPGPDHIPIEFYQKMLGYSKNGFNKHVPRFL